MTDVGVTTDERKKRSVFYQACTSTWKDDFPTLVKCLKASDPTGNPHTRQEAGFLLWHHALEGEDVGGLVSAGVLSACLTCLDTADVTITDKGCCAGILLALVADDEEVAETALKARAASSSNSCLEVLHAVVMLRDATNARAYAAKALQALARHAPGPFLRSLAASVDTSGGSGGPLSLVLPKYLSVWGGMDQKDAVVIASVAGVVMQLIDEKPDLAAHVVEAGGVEALLGALTRQKSEAAGTAVAALLARLVPNVEGAPERLVAAGGIELLADVLGPPPRSILTWEQHTLAEQAAAEEAEAAALAACSSSSSLGANGRGSGTGGGTPTAGTPKGGAGGKTSNSGGAEPTSPSGAAAPTPSGLKTRFSRDVTKDVAALNLGAAAGASDSGQGAAAQQVTGYGNPVPPVRVQLPLVIPGLGHGASGGSGAASPGVSPQPSSYSLFAAEASSMSVATTATGLAGGGGGRSGSAAAGLPPLPHPTDFSTNRSAIRWILLPGLDLASYAAACLAALLHNPEWLAKVDRRLVTHRILAQVKAVAAPKPAPEGKKKKKGLTLSPEQSAALTRLLGVVKILATTNTNRYRIAHLDAVPTLLVLYDEGPDYLLRNHCQNILLNVAVLAENGRQLLDAKTPEEFLVTNPMRLTSDERAGLRCEFPLEGGLEESVNVSSTSIFK